MQNNFIAKFAADGGPPPEEELDHILLQADGSEQHEAWFATRKRGAEWRKPGLCILIAASPPGAPIRALIARVVERHITMPDKPAVHDFYEGHHGFAAWWRVVNPIAVELSSLFDIPGLSTAGDRPASETFGGRVAFAYWDFGSFDGLTIPRAWTTKPKKTAPTGVVVRELDVPQLPPVAATIAEGEVAWARPSIALFGVDFSGGEEDLRSGNRKIWIAGWKPEDVVSLSCGYCNDPTRKICRSDLPKLIKESPGWWSLDFPFGVAKETAEAIGLDPNNWRGWLEWCAAGGDATERRNTARAATDGAGVRWSTRRMVDLEHRTTWFPLFEQLYRQTIYGGREVLLPLVDDCCILPWNWGAIAESTVVVVEGFPGATIRDRILHRTASYKGDTPAHRIQRENIVESLRSSPFRIPISDAVAQSAVGDSDGDAVDALTLLVGSWVAWRLGVQAWRNEFNRLNIANALVEGWFPV